MRNNTPKLKKRNESGMISITVAMVFIMVISLTVIGFAQVSQRNSREALDRQLSTQAFYAAESGINDVMNQISTLVDQGKDIPPQDECEKDTAAGGYTKGSGNVDTTTGAKVKYTCLLVKTELDDLKFDQVGDGSIVIPLNATTGNLGTEKLVWLPNSPVKSSSKFDKCPGTPKGGALTNILAAKWNDECPYGLLRVDIIPVNTTTLGDPVQAAKSTMTFFVYPHPNGNVPVIDYGNTSPNVYGLGAPQGTVFDAKCTKDSCEADMNLDLAGGSAYMRVRSLYTQTPSFQVHKESGTFKRSQVQVDVTGKAQDVLRRIQVRLSVTGSSSRSDVNDFSDYALQSTNSICKRFVVAPNYGAQDSISCPD
jgi:Tfp pilus assembly protein PilX